jgi:pSer/pThr/pTyr-binding forkhead associated (FHA) protein
VPPDSERTRVTRLKEVTGSKAALPGDACVVVIYGPDLGKRLQLGTAPFGIGRSARNDLPIDQESVSRHHARITFDGTDYWLQDLNSTNGTYVNDGLVREQRLSDGDQIHVGRSIVKYMTGENVVVQ